MRGARRVAFLLALAVATPASAVEFHIKTEGLRLDITESLFTSYHGDLNGSPNYALIVSHDATGMATPENTFVDLLNRLNVTLAWRRFRLATRFDTGVFFDTPNGSCGPAATGSS